jgi:hypothetical protein
VSTYGVGAEVFAANHPPIFTVMCRGYLLGSQSTNGTLWCLAVVFLLFATLIAIFALNMLKQVV